ncbi:hypothetical protein H0H93_003032 [Arthromyces matolae]|nr:hypothetical protein H0H93_003032 [Arthromyces matolae]
MLQARSINVREVFLPKYPGHQEEGCDTGSSDAHASASLLAGLDNKSLGSLFSTYLTALKAYVISAGKASRTNRINEKVDQLEQEVLKMEQAGVSALESFEKNTQVLLNELEKLKRLPQVKIA